jgi:hypothetical protein
MSCVIVPNSLRDAIYAKVDDALVGAPDAAPDRDYFYGVLLNYFNEHGVIPDFELKAKILSSRDDIEERKT